MFNWLRQIAAVTAMNLRNLPARPGPSLVAVLGVAAVVGVFAAVLSMAKGFERTMVAAGAEDVAIIFRAGSTTELNSGLSFEQTQIIAGAPGIARVDGSPVTSAELFVVVDLPKKSTNTSANVPLRGVQPGGYAVRPNLRIVEGRPFEPGRNEIVVGRAAQRQFAGLDVGQTVRFGQTDWQVVGAFEDGGGVSESELWCDVRVLQPAWRRGNTFQSVRARLEDPAAIADLEAALAKDPRVEVDVFAERDYYAEQSEGLSRFIRLVGYPVSILMAIGAVFAALNTMYASVAARTREIATLRAIGFRPSAVALATLIESTVLALIGGVVGGALVYIIFNGFTVSTLNGASFSQVVFDFAVTPGLLEQGMIAALIIGLVGGLFPALRAARLPVVTALREL
ncbi:MAG: ABC transporter permease [Gammaproteobacteria bacterium]